MQTADRAGGQRWISKTPVFIAVVVVRFRTGLGVGKAGRRAGIPTQP